MDKIQFYARRSAGAGDFWKGERMSDLIDREQAKDAIDKYLVGRNLVTDGTFMARLINEIVIDRLPSAEPQIVRCKDCKHWIPYDWMFSEMWQSKNIADYPEDDIGCDCSEMKMKANDFCSRGKRREVTT